MRSGKPAAAFAVLLVVSFATMNAMPSDTLLAALLQEAVLALVALAAVGFAVPDALKRCTQTVQQRSIVRFTAIILLLVGLVGGAITLLAWLFAGGGNMAGFASTALSSTADLMENLLLLLGICLLTGLYEESFMRVLGIEAFERTFGQGRAASGRAIGERDARPDASKHVAGGRSAHSAASGYAAGGRVGVSGEIGHGAVKSPIAFDSAAKRAILVSALLFALLHVGVPDVSADQLVLMRVHPCRLRCAVPGPACAFNRYDARNIRTGYGRRHRAACGNGAYVCRHCYKNKQRNCEIVLAHVR